MRKYIVASLLLSGVAAAQLRVPLLHRDPTAAEQAALHEKLTRLAETRQELGITEAQPSRELDALTVAARPKRTASTVAQKHTARQKSTASSWPPPDETWTASDREPSLGEVAKQYRAQKRQARSSTKQ